MMRFDDDLLSRWLTEGPQHGSAEAIDQLLARASASPQRPGWMVALAGGTIGSTVGSAALRYAAYALMVVALVGLLVGGMIAGGILGPEPRPAIVVDESPYPVASATATRGATDATPTPRPMVTATPSELPTAAALAPGTYIAPNPYLDQDPVRSCQRDLSSPPSCADYRRLTFDLPGGWATRDGLVYKHLGEAREVAFSVWTPGLVYVDGCRWRESALHEFLDIHDHTQEPALGSTALMNQLGRDASPPSEVMLGGQLALRIELSIPADFDLASCDGGEYRSWSEWDVEGGGNSHHAPGQVDVVYIIDVDVRPLLIDASHMPGADAGDLAELEAILASMVIER